MRVILDNCVPRTLRRYIAGHEVVTAGELGWADTDDGPLVALLDPVCDAFVTVDKRLPQQQRLAHRTFGTVVLRARSNRVEDLALLVPELLLVLSRIGPGDVVYVGSLADSQRDVLS